MKNDFTLPSLIFFLGLLLLEACTQSSSESQSASASLPAPAGGQSSVKDDESQKNIVQVAVGSPDHKTLVAALEAAQYVDALSNAGPFTVFAPTDAAFAKVPKETLQDLMKPANKVKLQDVLEYHVYVGVIRESIMQPKMNLNQVNGKNVTLMKEGDKIRVNNANVIATVETSNGIIYVIDEVLIP